MKIKGKNTGGDAEGGAPATRRPRPSMAGRLSLSGRIPGFLQRHSLEAAPLLLGWVLCRELPDGIVKLKIVETEAYNQSDPASHSYRGLTKRTAPMFQAGGTIYVYFSYGMHYALNIVVGQEGVGEAVLLRAGEPLEGIKLMQRNRGITELKKLTNGPGKLAQALGIKDTQLSGKRLNSLSELLNKSSIYLEPPAKIVNSKDIIAAPRIGITKAADQPWRFYIRNNQFVSKI